MERELMTADEAADFLRIHRNRLYVLIREGTVPAIRIGKRIRVSRRALEQMIASAEGSMNEQINGKEKVA